MPIFMNPFAKHDVSDFPDVYVPLADAHRYASVVAQHEEKSEKSEKSSSPDGPGGEADGRPSLNYSAYTIEGLRAEIETDLAVSGHDAVYDRMSSDTFLVLCELPSIGWSTPWPVKLWDTPIMDLTLSQENPKLLTKPYKI